MINLEYSEHRVAAVNTINDDLFELLVERNGMEFTPGDCVAVYTEHDQSRPYSIASGPGKDLLRFLIREMDGGEVSPWLRNRNPGEAVRITPPFGWFRPGQDIGEHPFVFLATGTGIAPFIAYMETFNRPPEAVLYGVRRAADAFGFSALQNFCTATQLAVSREASEHHHGRLTDLLPDLPRTENMHYYCCGLESMVNDTAAWLQKNGLPLSQIHREVFFHG
ncbi:ferredoxin--NADP reductase [Pontiella agarivorans]|uniref:FAD-dependent oxidoreductase n=1 Tax=Pontiella agarivorans TaxID=3038953 RepID=A0ABU5MUF9_9BACT|nr:FAD-dependent oxidoreductase [Pontiella agarivorans]MDZ8117854.1 FAD-dependent oxidoreductase [Pontiella agarivorans]